MGIMREVDLCLDSGRRAIFWGPCVKRQEGVGVDVPTESESDMVRYLLVVGADDPERAIIVDLPPLLFDQLLGGLQLII